MGLISHHIKIMKRESASKLFYICSAGCGILAFLFVWFCAGSSDYWTLVEQTEVPGNLDVKYVAMAAIFTLASISFYTIGNRIKYYLPVVKSLKRIYYDDSILEEINNNRRFEMQVCDFINMFQKGVYGDLSAQNEKANKKYREAGKGRLIGKYHSTQGIVKIITNTDQTKMEVTFLNTIYKVA